MIVSSFLALKLNNVKQIFDIIILFGAGTGLIFILRWFWWRINAWSEIAAMFSSGIISIILNFTAIGAYFFNNTDGVFPTWAKFPVVVLITTIIWVAVTFITQPESKDVLRNFYKNIQPGGPGWSKVILEAQKDNIEIVDKTQAWSVPSGIIAMLLGCTLIYSCLFATGYWIYGDYNWAIGLTIVVIISALLLRKVWGKIKINIL